jgi:pimeloyl-ACP methyl ester carboxylesterase
MANTVHRTIASWCMLFATALLMGGCMKSDKKIETPATDSKSSYPRYFFQEPGNKGVIVFMHGVLGNAEATWTNSKTGEFWPDLVKNDPEFKGFDIYVYQFPTTLFKRSMSIDELSEDLRLELQNAKVFDHKEVIFVCHSMGGLVTRSFLQKYQSYAPKISFIYFFSTPTEGSEIAALAKWLSKNPQFGDMIPISDTNYLATQLRAWLAAQFPIASYCAYEDQATVGQQVVPMRSAAALCNKPLTPISANHMQIVKPKDQNDKPHKALQNAFRQTRPVIVVDIPKGWTLREVIESVVEADTSTGDQFRTNYIGCEDFKLDQIKMRDGRVEAQTRELVIERLPSRTEALQSTVRLEVSKNENNSVYEIRCQP